MTPKLICSDIDGTLLNAERDLSAFTISEIKRLTPNIPFILVSARMPKQMTHLQNKAGLQGEPLIAYNGALVIANSETIYSTEIPQEIMEYIVDYNENQGEENFHISLYHNDEWYVPQYDYWAKREENNTKVTPEISPNANVLAKWNTEKKGAHKITCMGDEAYIEKAFQHFSKTIADKVHLYRAKDTYIEIAPKTVSKLTGIKELLQHSYPSIKVEDVIAFGDNYNDTEMIANVGLGVAVANARDEVKNAAKAITKHHKEDGVAVYLHELIA